MKATKQDRRQTSLADALSKAAGSVSPEQATPAKDITPTLPVSVLAAALDAAVGSSDWTRAEELFSSIEEQCKDVARKTWPGEVLQTVWNSTLAAGKATNTLEVNPSRLRCPDL